MSARRGQVDRSRLRRVPTERHPTTVAPETRRHHLRQGTHLRPEGRVLEGPDVRPGCRPQADEFVRQPGARNGPPSLRHFGRAAGDLGAAVRGAGLHAEVRPARESSRRDPRRTGGASRLGALGDAGTADVADADGHEAQRDRGERDPEPTTRAGESGRSLQSGDPVGHGAEAALVVIDVSVAHYGEPTQPSAAKVEATRRAAVRRGRAAYTAAGTASRDR